MLADFRSVFRGLAAAGLVAGVLGLPPGARGQILVGYLPPEVWKVLETYGETREEVDQLVEDGRVCFTTREGETACVLLDPRLQELYRAIEERVPSIAIERPSPGVVLIDVDESISVSDTGLARGAVGVEIDDGVGVGDGGSVRPPAGIDVGETIGAGDEAETNDPVGLGIDERIGADEAN